MDEPTDGERGLSAGEVAAAVARVAGAGEEAGGAAGADPPAGRRRRPPRGPARAARVDRHAGLGTALAVWLGSAALGAAAGALTAWAVIEPRLADGLRRMEIRLGEAAAKPAEPSAPGPGSGGPARRGGRPAGRGGRAPGRAGARRPRAVDRAGARRRRPDAPARRGRRGRARDARPAGPSATVRRGRSLAGGRGGSRFPVRAPGAPGGRGGRGRRGARPPRRRTAPPRTRARLPARRRPAVPPPAAATRRALRDPPRLGQGRGGRAGRVARLVARDPGLAGLEPRQPQRGRDRGQGHVLAGAGRRLPDPGRGGCRVRAGAGRDCRVVCLARDRLPAVGGAGSGSARTLRSGGRAWPTGGRAGAARPRAGGRQPEGRGRQDHALGQPRLRPGRLGRAGRDRRQRRAGQRGGLGGGRPAPGPVPAPAAGAAGGGRALGRGARAAARPARRGADRRAGRGGARDGRRPADGQPGARPARADELEVSATYRMGRHCGRSAPSAPTTRRRCWSCRPGSRRAPRRSGASPSRWPRSGPTSRRRCATGGSTRRRARRLWVGAHRPGSAAHREVLALARVVRARLAARSPSAWPRPADPGPGGAVAGAPAFIRSGAAIAAAKVAGAGLGGGPGRASDCDRATTAGLPAAEPAALRVIYVDEGRAARGPLGRLVRMAGFARRPPGLAQVTAASARTVHDLGARRGETCRGDGRASEVTLAVPLK